MPRSKPSPLSLALVVLRATQGWTQRQLAAAIGLPDYKICRYEAGRPSPTRAEFESMAAAMGCEPEAIDLVLLTVASVVSRN